ncbi:MAG: UDP-2,4-diacetamido-2,4,6-trideoxy-beta-L-altropyranose hydrolase [Anaerolineae bacterium]|nr:UDP-2,4-diacetamido-2,4,6-trideoxy-beta-L-altropyranose hydrolase [Anaerolineae bacterium]
MDSLVSGKMLLVRADASTQIGTGHVMRCLALAHAWQEEGGQAHFLLGHQVPRLETRLAQEGMVTNHLLAPPGSQKDAQETISLARQLQADWIIVDGYHFDAAYQLHLKEAGMKLLCIDDYGHADHYYADLVLNQNIHAEEKLYHNREAGTQLLLGTRYVLLRREFWSWRGWKRVIAPAARKMLITLGGSDPDNQTAKVMAAIQQLEMDEAEVVVVVGAGNPHVGELQTAAQQAPFSARLAHNVSNMPELMAWADVAISAAGSTCWELAFMALPSLLLAVAANQHSAAVRLAEIKAFHNLGKAENVDAESIKESLFKLIQSVGVRSTMSGNGARLVDGYGVMRVLKALV